jgi:hypothetical protein
MIRLASEQSRRENGPTYFGMNYADFFFAALDFAHRFFAAFAIAALPAADRTRFFAPLTSTVDDYRSAFVTI